MKINVIDLFAGCGGLTDGFLKSGKYNTLAAVDWELSTVLTLRNRMANKWRYDDVSNRVIHFDLQRTDELLHGFDDEIYGKEPGLEKLVGDKQVDLVIGGPPCQAYSIAGRVRDEHGMKNDYRNFLFESYVKLVEHFQPKAFVFENVEGMLTASPGGIPIVQRIRQAFSSAGYDISNDLRKDALFDISFYGVPQKRKRVIIFGVRRQDKSLELVQTFYDNLKGLATKNPLPALSAFENLPKIFPLSDDKKHSHVVDEKSNISALNHIPRRHSKRDIEIFKLLTEDIRNKTFKYNTTQALIKLYKDKTGRDSNFHKYHVIREDRPSNTIPAHLYKDGLRHIHPDPAQARSITVREAARLQSFDDDFEFLGSRTDQYKMVGNAVPPKFARILGDLISELLPKINVDDQLRFKWGKSLALYQDK